MLKRLIPLIICALYAVTTYAFDCNDEGLYSVSTVEDLRAAVDCGNSDGIDTQINLAANTYDLSGGQIEVTGQVSIIGVSQETTILDAMSTNRHFYVSGSAANLTLENITLQNGYTSFDGGAISIMYASTVSLDNSTLSGNIASRNGGAMYIYSRSTVSLNNSILSENAANAGGTMWIYSSTVSLDNSTLSGNTAKYGGAMSVDYSTVSLDDSTLSGNTATSFGGAMYITFSSIVSLDNSTLSENTNSYAVVYNSSSSLNLKNSIFNNTSKNCYTYGTSSSITTSSGYNLATDNSCNLTAEGDQQSVDPLLDVLADNGGPTMTHALLEGSPAIDAGSCTDIDGNTVETDQRGYWRPAGLTCDSGSYEDGASELTATLKKKCYIQDDGSYSTGCDGTRTEKGKVTYTLLWDGFADSTVDIWVDDSLYLSATTNDEAEFITLTQDYIASTFKVCEVGTSVCSNEVQELMTTTGMQTGETDGEDGQRRHR